MAEQAPDRNLALELVRVTEAAALAAGRWVGRGDKIAADQAAVDAMRLMLDTVSMEEITVVILDRDRHEDMIASVRESGARVFLITDGDVAPAIAAARPGTGIDMLMGIGGTPEGVIAASALKCLGGTMQGRLFPRNDEEKQRLLDGGVDVERGLTTDDLVKGNDVFFAATRITDGSLLRGVTYDEDGVHTYSMVMRSRSGTVRYVDAQHSFEKLEIFTGREYRR